MVLNSNGSAVDLMVLRGWIVGTEGLLLSKVFRIFLQSLMV